MSPKNSDLPKEALGPKGIREVWQPPSGGAAEWTARARCSAGRAQRFGDDRLRLVHDRVQVRLVAEALRVDLVDVLGARGPRCEPAVRGHDLEAADLGAVAGRLHQLRRDRLARELVG